MYLGFSLLHGNLPIFVRPEGDSVLYYTPGLVIRADQKMRAAVEAEIASEACQSPLLETFVRRAQATNKRWSAIASQKYEPVCLTIYLDNRCNLECKYCYAAPSGHRSSSTVPVSLSAVRNAAELVAENCRHAELPFTVVIHGGGEPSLDLSLLKAALAVIDEVASQKQVKMFKYIATNGVMTAIKAKWLASHFDLIGISCDGPPDIQHMQRPLPNGMSSTRYIERTACILHEMDAAFHVRVTITPNTISRQEEIVDYINERLGPQEIHLEPVYAGGRERDGFVSTGTSQDAGDLARTFVTHFLTAQTYSRAAGIPLHFSGSRPWDVHGPYCQVFRDVLQLVPGNAASPCFKLNDAQQVNALGARIGQNTEDGFIIDQANVQALRRSVFQQENGCQACFNHQHCVRGCPDICGLESSCTDAPTFRCQVQMRLSGAVIDRAATGLVVSSRTPLAGASIRVET